ncbi:LPS export ABC transporter ATP-binding protein [Dissulfurirhabdus thermomarina]|uniref:LPS export ABC transporter ATP-binding protein n=1 Tax=Dissulfurirhabdus thermomarina TaxID=1765737 RepID=A0A6N9TKY6_DISTH|nr:LPS export ABC transporter ATP-binding protein [Dissulfurirhabdus thermomarina]NDY41728.1 LPS export ABC transporter ATP-binding protein [Dissulfurirhabdus thermomarina]NMX23664.1 LPS export ABC transporter ATP-binding protein [Dissulfurirhabdus thermomarina]
MARLEARGLVKTYKSRRVVDHVDIDVADHAIVGLLGPNGAGKTTSFYMIAGLVRPDGGQVLLDGQDVTDLPMHLRARRGITYLPQEASVFRRLTVAENIRLVFESRDVPRREAENRTRELLDDMGLYRLADNKAHSLSGGERRRVEVLRALATDPSFILLDEPFAGVDPLAVADLQEVIRGLKARGLGVLISDHNVRETLTVCDRAYIVSAGAIIEEGPPAHIAASPVARQIYLGEDFTL